MGLGSRWTERHWTGDYAIESGVARALTQEERQQTGNALQALLFDFEHGDPDATRVIRRLHRSLAGLGPALAQPSRQATESALQREAIGRDLQRALQAGRFSIQPQVRGPVARRAQQLSVAPGLAPAPEEQLGFFAARFVDEVGAAIAGLEVVLTADGKPNQLTTDGSGKVKVENVQGSFGSLRVSSIQALRDIVEPRWEKLREGPFPKAPVLKQLPLTEQLSALSLESSQELVIVVVPPLGKLFAALLDKTGRVELADCEYEIDGPMKFEGVTDGDGRLQHDGVLPGDYTLKLTLESFDGSEVDQYQVPLVVLAPDAALPQTRMVGFIPRATLASVSGLLFDTNKTFLLPHALDELRKLRRIYEENRHSELLIVGHTDTTGEPAVNDPLSLERADSMAAFLKDDVDTWLKNYDASQPEKKRWGKAEDLAMIGALPDFDTKLPNETAVTWYQKRHNAVSVPARDQLEVDGVAGPLTRKELIFDYMSLDEATLDEDFAINVTTHGAGENFPLDDAATGLDDAPQDAKDDQADRRVELFFFDSEFGILPKPPGKNSTKGSTQYLKWRERSHVVHRAVVGRGAATVDLRLQDMPGPNGIPLSFTPWELRDGDKLLEAGETDQDGRVNLETKLSPGDAFTLRFAGRDLTLRLAQFDPVDTPQGRQARLAFLGYNTGPLDGSENERTLAALLDFQRDHELEVTGKPDDASDKKLVELAKG